MMKRTLIMDKYPQNRGLEKEPIEWIVRNKYKKAVFALASDMEGLHFAELAEP